MPAGRRVEHLGPEDVPVGDHDAEIGLQPPEAGKEQIPDGLGRLEHREADFDERRS